MADYVLTPIHVDVAKARAAVAAQGSPRQRARLTGILDLAEADRAVARELAALQNPDGGFSPDGGQGAPSGVAATCRILAQLKELPPLAGSPMASRAVAFLRRSQLPDGSWREAAAPAVSRGAGQAPGETELTARATFTILTLEPGHLDPVLRGSGWLRRKLAGTSAEGAPSPATLALAWALWVRLLEPGASEAQWAFRLLEQREGAASPQAADGLPTVDLADWLLCGLEVGAGGPWLLPLARRLGELAGRQGPDGLWSGGGDPVENTLTALRSFRLCGLLQEG